MDIKDKTSNDKIYKVQTSSQLAQVLEITKKIEPQKSYFNAQRIKGLAWQKIAQPMFASIHESSTRKENQNNSHELWLTTNTINKL